MTTITPAAEVEDPYARHLAARCDQDRGENPFGWSAPAPARPDR
ncbi:hypothetical protein [Streptomyces sp. DH8]|nr:hypothetical protein [Streptomyces sp. DH8]